MQSIISKINQAWGLSFLYKMFKAWCRCQNWRKKIKSFLGFGDDCIWIGCVKHLLLSRENTCDHKSKIYQTVSILLRQNFLNRSSFRLIKKMAKLLSWRFQWCFGRFNMLTLDKCSDGRHFSYLSKTLFAVYNFEIYQLWGSYFFSKSSKFDVDLRNLEKKTQNV